MSSGWIQFAFPKQITQAVDDVAGALGRFGNFLVDLLELGNVWRVVLEHELRGLAVAEDRRQRLVDLVRDRS